jgi:hypothetical protein
MTVKLLGIVLLIGQCFAVLLIDFALGRFGRLQQARSSIVS